MNEENLSLDPGDTSVDAEGIDPGNSDPEEFTSDLTDEEILEANAVVEAVIQTLPTENEGAL